MLPKAREYTEAFEKCWAVHRVGKKYEAWDQGVESGFTDEDWLELAEHLTQRHIDDKSFQEGYVPHLCNFIKKRRWEDGYTKVAPQKAKEYTGPVVVQESHEEAQAKIDQRNAELEASRKAREELKKRLDRI